MVEALRKLASKPIEGLQDLDDATLVSRCKRELPHDLTSYRELIRRYEGLIYNTCRRVIGSDQDAEEVAQDTLLRIFHKIHQFEGRSSFKAWLYKIVHNDCRRRISKIVRKREKLDEYEDYSTNEQRVHEDSDHKSNLSQAVEEALSLLKKPERELIVLRFMSGLKLQEIADILEVNLSAAKMRLYRALESFKEAYDSLDDAPPLSLFTKKK